MKPARDPVWLLALTGCYLVLVATALFDFILDSWSTMLSAGHFTLWLIGIPALAFFSMRERLQRRHSPTYRPIRWPLRLSLLYFALYAGYFIFVWLRDG